MLEQMSGGDIGEVEGRVLAHQDDVGCGQVELDPSPRVKWLPLSRRTASGRAQAVTCPWRKVRSRGR